jgi:hypothetical protein
MIDIDFNNFPFTFNDDGVYGTTKGFFKTPSTSYYQGRITIVTSTSGRSFIIPINRNSYYIFK